MEKTKQKIAIAQSIGWEWITESTQGRYQGIRPENTKRYCNWTRHAPAIDVEDGREWHWIPDYLNCLDAMNEVEEVAQYHVGDYCRMLAQVTSMGSVENMTQYNLLHASAAQRAEAFLKTVGRWDP